MRALISVDGTVIPERVIAEILPLGNGKSRVVVTGTIGAIGPHASDLLSHCEDVSGSPIQLAELLGWQIVNKQEAVLVDAPILSCERFYDDRGPTT